MKAEKNTNENKDTLSKVLKTILKEILRKPENTDIYLKK